MDLDYGEVVGDDDDVNPSLEDLRKTSFYDITIDLHYP